MLTKINNILSELKDIAFLQPIFEAVNNSLEAHASIIDITIHTSPWMFNEDEEALAQLAIESLSITDNGDGFNKRNLESFCEYLSDYKAKLGCKGVGRFTWLKVFNKVEIISEIKNDNKDDRDKKISFIFDTNFDKFANNPTLLQQKVEELKQPIQSNKTTITFIGINDSYIKSEDRIFTLKDFTIKLQVHLLPNLLLLKQSGKPFNIRIHVQGAKESMSIIPSKLPAIQEESFTIEKEFAGNPTKTQFKLSYAFLKNHEARNMHYYCANNRTVMSFGNVNEERISFSAPQTDSSIFLLQSKYFDELCNNGRNAFKDIKPKESSLSAILSWNDINSHLKPIISKVSQKQYPELTAKNEQILEELVNQNPHLVHYIRKNQKDIGLSSSEDMLRRARKDFENDKASAQKQFVKALKTSKVDSTTFKEAVTKIEYIAALDLAQYIYFRQNIIAALKDTHDRAETQEKLLHFLFSKKSYQTQNNSYLDSNIWLLDDKFMTYNYIASDLTMKKIGKFWSTAIRPEDRLKRPDLFVTFSKPENELGTDCAIIEFKACGATNDEKRKAISEIWDNLGAVRDNFPNIRNIWGYIITSIDENFAVALKRNHFRPLFSNGENNLFYSFNEELNIHCYALSTEVIVNDANSRNKVFLDIIKSSR